MCGRYVLKATLPEIARLLGMDVDMALEPRYNIAPTQDVPVCSVDEQGERRLGLMRWGLVPHWAKDPKSAYRMINARAETVADKPSFRVAFRRRRCLIPADGYYEWKATGSRKQPYFIHMTDGRPFCFAGLWEIWQPPEAEPLHSCAIITTKANRTSARVHPRMPVIVPETDYEPWLDPDISEPEAISPLLRPYPPETMTLYPVSSTVNNPRADDERCITPISDPE